MSGTSEVLQEYLVKLGFKVDQGDYKKFTDSLGVVGKRVLGVGVAVAGVVAGVEAAAAAFAYSMRKVYFDSQLAQSSVKNLQSLSYAGTQVGISAESMGSAIHNMAQQLRLNPGLRGVIESFGVKVEGRDVSDVMQDYVKALGSMPEFQAAQFAGMFGMDPDTYHQFRNNADAIMAKQKEMKDVYKSLGVDMDEAAKTGTHYANSLDNVKMHFGALENAVLTGVLPAFDKFTAGMVHNMDVVTKWLNLPVREGFGGALGIALGLKSAHGEGGSVQSHLTPYAIERMKQQGVRFGASAPGTPLSAAEKARFAGAHAPTAAASAAGTPSTAASFAAIEAKYGLPAGMLAKIYAIESDSGRNTKTSKAGAVGPFQIEPATGADLGMSGDDLKDLGKSSNGAGKYLGQLLKRYGGDADKAVAAYNWGMGNVDKNGLANLPKETSDYLDKYHGMGGGVTVQNTFHITGNNATDIANKVAGAESRVMADALRNGQGTVR